MALTVRLVGLLLGCSGAPERPLGMRKALEMVLDDESRLLLLSWLAMAEAEAAAIFQLSFVSTASSLMNKDLRYWGQ